MKVRKRVWSESKGNWTNSKISESDINNSKKKLKFIITIMFYIYFWRRRNNEKFGLKKYY